MSKGKGSAKEQGKGSAKKNAVVKPRAPYKQGGLKQNG